MLRQVNALHNFQTFRVSFLIVLHHELRIRYLAISSSHNLTISSSQINLFMIAILFNVLIDIQKGSSWYRSLLISSNKQTSLPRRFFLRISARILRNDIAIVNDENSWRHLNSCLTAKWNTKIFRLLYLTSLRYL